MNKLIYLAFASAVALTGCIEEVDPMTDIVTGDQANNAPGSYENFVGTVTTSLSGQFNYWPEKQYPFDFGITSFYLARDVMGQDIVITNSGDYYALWAYAQTAITPGYAICQFPWTDYFQWVKNCNTVIQIAGDNPSEEHMAGAGIAYCIRAMLYMDMAQMFNTAPYTVDKEALTVTKVTEKTTMDELSFNPRVTNEALYAFMEDDLNKAETYLAGYRRPDKTTPDLSVVYGLKARLYLLMGRWADAEKYAHDAQAGYTMMSEAEYLDRNTGFNTPNSSWMLATRFKADSECILKNDADSSWGSHMCIDMFHLGGDGCGYAANYGYPLAIDRHLYETIPATDFRKKNFIDFKAADYADLNDEANVEALIELCSQYSDYPEELAMVPTYKDYPAGIGGLSVKFRPNGGETGRANQYVGFLTYVPMMRVEEMMLIEAEAAGMQQESRGIELLTKFALTRDPSYRYGQHTEQYYGNNSAFQNEIWWQRRVELWGEGFASNDVKRFGKGIIRSYAGTNHLAKYRWNLDKTPQWMVWCIGGTDTDYNYSLIQNPIPVPPTDDSPEYVF